MADLPRIYIDACCFIDMVKTHVGASVESDRELDVWYLKRILEANRDREVEVFTSTLTLAECQHAGDGNSISETVRTEFSRLLMSGQYVRLVELTPFIGEEARDLRWKHEIALRGADSVHVASALEMGCGEFFSSDKRLERVSRYSERLSRQGLAVMHGRETKLLPSRYRQLKLPGEGKH